ncbi:hypothetical protein C3486_27875 [Streptomyces sp. Ru73]|nr:hypothetical protein C3486_27875 [Streptomyces sp. Ru73]
MIGAEGCAHAAVVVQVPSGRPAGVRGGELAPRLVESAEQVARVVPSERAVRAVRYAVEGDEA